MDACVYIWLAEIMTAILRVTEGRNLWHRMGGRTVVIGDVPWVAQSAEAFLSKCFACSYAIAGVTVMSGNPADHLVHRFTHRVVRGTLLACGRPDGRLSALTTAETSVCLSVNQASSIQSLGVTCESITLGHNPAKLGLAAHGLTLPTRRPRYLCEQLLAEELASRGEMSKADALDPSVAKLPTMSAGALLGEYMSIRNAKRKKPDARKGLDRSLSVVVWEAMEMLSPQNKSREEDEKKMRLMFDLMDADGNGTLDEGNVTVVHGSVTVVSRECHESVTRVSR